MAPYVNPANIVLVLAAGVLLAAAITDLKRYTISNTYILTLVVLLIAYTAITGRWSTLAWNVVIATLLFVVLFFFYSRAWMGGGDVKILTVAFLWIASDCALLFAILLCAFASIHGVAAKLNWAPSQNTSGDKRARIAFAPSVAAALIGTFLLGCLHRV
jgi:prepilin peptidase CpaA